MTAAPGWAFSRAGFAGSPGRGKVPHMGWNRLRLTAAVGPARRVDEGEHVYFVHSYAVQPAMRRRVGATDYGGELVAAVEPATSRARSSTPRRAAPRGCASTPTSCPVHAPVRA